KDYSFFSAVFLTLFLIFFGLSSIRCIGKTDKKENIESSLKEICMRRFGFSPLTKANRKNLGTLVIVENIFDEKTRDRAMKRMLLCAGEALARIPTEQEFFHVILRDNISGVENLYTFSIKDIQKNFIGAISPAEFRNRTLMMPDNNLSLLGKKRIEQFFGLLPGCSLEEILKASPQITMKIFSKRFLHHLLETSMKENANYDMLLVKMKAVSNEQMLFYVKARHTFDVKSGFQESSFKYSPGDAIHFIFKVENESYLDVRISEIYTFEDRNSFFSSEIPKDIQELDYPETWSSDDFSIEDMTLPGFVSRLVAQRLRAEINSLTEEEGKEPEIKIIEGSFKNGKGIHLVFQMKTDQMTSLDEIRARSIMVTKTVCQIYDFRKLQSLEIIFPRQGIFETIGKKELGL
ncbi:MAG: hypothetical protein JW928_05105, partial [Candidatus Aureabacteria bacterium]|nr:hypothetical protein [Candidatus Auribacterota bacterium]